MKKPLVLVIGGASLLVVLLGAAYALAPARLSKAKAHRDAQSPAGTNDAGVQPAAQPAAKSAAVTDFAAKSVFDEYEGPFGELNMGTGAVVLEIPLDAGEEGVDLPEERPLDLEISVVVDDTLRDSFFAFGRGAGLNLDLDRVEIFSGGTPLLVHTTPVGQEIFQLQGGKFVKRPEYEPDGEEFVCNSGGCDLMKGTALQAQYRRPVSGGFALSDLLLLGGPASITVPSASWHVDWNSVGVTRITNDLGWSTEIVYSGARISFITDRFGRRIDFDYDAAGRLSRIRRVGPQGNVLIQELRYLSNGLLDYFILPNNSSQFAIRYRRTGLGCDGLRVCAIEALPSFPATRIHDDVAISYPTATLTRLTPSRGQSPVEYEYQATGLRKPVRFKGANGKSLVYSRGAPGGMVDRVIDQQQNWSYDIQYDNFRIKRLSRREQNNGLRELFVVNAWGGTNNFLETDWIDKSTGTTHRRMFDDRNRLVEDSVNPGSASEQTTLISYTPPSLSCSVSLDPCWDITIKLKTASQTVPQYRYSYRNHGLMVYEAVLNGTTPTYVHSIGYAYNGPRLLPVLEVWPQLNLSVVHSQFTADFGLPQLVTQTGRPNINVAYNQWGQPTGVSNGITSVGIQYTQTGQGRIGTLQNLGLGINQEAQIDWNDLFLPEAVHINGKTNATANFPDRP